MENVQELKTRLQSIRTRIEKAAKGCGRNPESVRLVAVIKTVPIHRVREAIEAGVTILGVNYVQEARTKMSELAAHPISWHFIGHLQSNKAKVAVRLFDLIHSVDTLKLARELNKHAGNINKIQEILVQVNIGEEAAKSGVALQDTQQLLEHISALDHLAVKGLMSMPPFFNDPEKVRPFFSALRELRDRLGQHLPHVTLNELSMGMTGDFEVAVKEGATLVRIGTAIFGERK
ncbi:MAG: YggS family pyridoxal phosphate-dependent enzyme [Desulfobacterales bacterium]|uniref:Pyridoxal phosphate homeostasis protein n=1 Tax=Candidatus Desulfatibia profunda TaxID=2841695 RepID=A0A8J6NYY0_9BACT|nr:YggS family pyridoxal phosphate-dependent enzyme [Candidatus Desulfatibia profunda]MBL7179332.1 YggS family pyridoxal phosphate-dependent enzyme [Desulfobacterales bacterium]